MAENINLLPQQNEESNAQTRQRKLIKQVSSTVLAVTIFAVIALFAGQFVLGMQLQGIEDDIVKQEARITAKKTEEGIQQSLISRVHTLDDFFNQQNHFSSFLANLSKTFPSTLKLTDMSVTKEKQVTLTGSVASYAELAGFYAKLVQSGVDEDSSAGDFTDPTLTRISRNEESGAIEFILTFTINPTLLTSMPVAGEAQ